MFVSISYVRIGHTMRYFAPFALVSFLSVGVTCPVIAQNKTGNLASPINLETITVSAAKRKIPLSDVTGSLVVVPQDGLERSGITSAADLNRIVPGLSSSKRGSGAFTGLSLRGIAPLDYYSPAVMVYVDGVPQDEALVDQDLGPVERVEVLKGPQGSLYGRNAYSGAINIITQKPSAHTMGYVRSRISNHEQGGRVYVSGPLVRDKAYASLSVGGSHISAQADHVSTATQESNVDDGRTRHINGHLRYAPTGSPLDVSVRFGYNHNRERNAYFTSLEAVKSGRADALYGTDPFSDYNSRHTRNASVSASYTTDVGTFKSITALQDRTMDRFMAYAQNEKQKRISQELQFAFTPSASSLSGMVGLYADQTDFKRQTTAFGSTGSLNNTLDTRTYALFGEGRWAATNRLAFTAGGRFSYDSAKLLARETGGTHFDTQKYWHSFTPKVGVTWKWADNLTQFAAFSQGYKPGGFNRTSASLDAQTAYGPETSRNYEIGIRGDFFDKKLSLSGATYVSQLTDIQIYTGQVGSQLLRNAGDGQARGIEFDAQARLTPSLSLTGAVNMVRSAFDGGDYDGKKIPHVPTWTGHLGLESYHDLPSLSGTLVPRLNLRWAGKRYFNENNTLTQGQYAVVDAHLSYESEAVTVTAFVKNALDKTYKTYDTGFGMLPGDGRSIGLEVAVRF